jgi:hypothetical protein
MPYSASARVDAKPPRLSPARDLFEFAAICGAVLLASCVVARFLAELLVDGLVERLAGRPDRPRRVCGTRRIVRHRGGLAASPHRLAARRDA